MYVYIKGVLLHINMFSSCYNLMSKTYTMIYSDVPFRWGKQEF